MFWKKALLYRVAAHRSAEAEGWDPAVSAAVHATINLADALSVHFGGLRSASDAHHDALQVLGQVEGIPTETRRALVKHLGALLSVKTFAEYDGELLATADARSALLHMERAFEAAKAVTKGAGWTG